VWAERLDRSTPIRSGDHVHDIGAGTGALTGPLLDAGARVLAVEAHAGRADVLRRRFGAAVTVIEVDASDLRLPRRPFHVVANPPFAIASPLLRRLTSPGSWMQSATVVLPVPVVRRWAGPEAPAARRWQRVWTTRDDGRLPRSAFRPPPQVPCAVLHLDRPGARERLAR
jgi:23S rRNA (adenine-N6)-dimethyltransferase